MNAASLPPFAALRAFEMVGRTGGIRKAAEALGISHAIVSRHVAALEDLLGVQLLNRQTGVLTEVGQAYHCRISGAMAELTAATQAVRAGRGDQLTIWCSPGFSLHWLARRLPDFARASGRGTGQARPVLDLHSTDSEPMFDRNEADGDIRYRFDAAPGMPPRGVRTEDLARPPVFPVASPEVLAGLSGGIATLAALKALPLIQETSAAEWQLWLAGQGVAAQDLPPPVARYGQAHLTMAAARAGQGIALSNRFLAAEDLATGRLVRVVPQDAPLVPLALGTYVFRCARARWHDPMLVRFRGWLQQAIAEDVDAA